MGIHGTTGLFGDFSGFKHQIGITYPYRYFFYFHLLVPFFVLYILS